MRNFFTQTDRISENSDDIIRNIVNAGILDHLMTHLVISADDRRRIEQHAGQDDQNKVLLDIVTKKGEPSYTFFVDALQKSGYTDIARNLQYESQDVRSTSASAPTENIGNFCINVCM